MKGRTSLSNVNLNRNPRRVFKVPESKPGERGLVARPKNLFQKNATKIRNRKIAKIRGLISENSRIFPKTKKELSNFGIKILQKVKIEIKMLAWEHARETRSIRKSSGKLTKKSKKLTISHENRKSSNQLSTKRTRQTAVQSLLYLISKWKKIRDV